MIQLFNQDNIIDDIQTLALSKKIVGIDEVGYGCWAGPLYICALEFKSDFDYKVSFCDSKSICAKKREYFYEIIKEVANWKIAKASAKEINEYGLALAYRKTLESAVEPFLGKELIIDGRKPKYLECKAVIKGDSKVQQIAAASIVAKVERDLFMYELDKQFPEYYWKDNKGYGTKKHIQGIKQHGFCEYHRTCYDLVKYL